MVSDNRLHEWGWDERWAAELARMDEPGLTPARVVAQHRGRWLAMAADGEAPALPTGRFRYQAEEGDLPAVGDWVVCSPSTHPGDLRIVAVLPRRSTFRRRAAGSTTGAQIVAANVDTLLVATSIDRDLNMSRLERYVAMGRESGAETVILLTKSDLRDGATTVAEQVAATLSVDVVALSAATGEGIERTQRWFAPERTLALVGSSGVGKSTLLNRIAGERLMATREIREDDGRGRHTTTHRELFRVPGGALILDTPGMRELGLWDAEEGLEETFADLAELATRCRFKNCSHRFEPGCAVLAEMAEGRLDPRRLRSYRRLAHELEEQPTPLERRQRDKAFGKMVRRIGSETADRKIYREYD